VKSQPGSWTTTMFPEKIRLLNVSMGGANNAEKTVKWVC
jgi:hypothetical protein